ncbi:unnamed protein product [Clavelina lepadiformis]|uniref:Uncharacterized protein n=1 Tax=Clavelina lepadiformis TaxID=159417 RepID=A0ABP0GXW1_CLALP
MVEKINLQILALGYQQNIKDSLELVDAKTGITQHALTKKGQFSRDKSRCHISDDIDCFMDSESDGSCNDDTLSTQNSGSSVEIERRSSLPNYAQEQQHTNHLDLQQNAYHCNSTLKDGLFAVPIEKLEVPFISPILDERKISSQCFPEANKKEKIYDCNGMSNDVGKHKRGTQPPDSELSKLEQVKEDMKETNLSELDGDWICCKRLKPASLKMFTPKRLSHDGPFTVPQQPAKSHIRTSSPAFQKPTPKAKKAILENLELSAIVQVDNSFTDSLELIPRADTPGTVNSDEIVVCSFTRDHSSDLLPPRQEMEIDDVLENDLETASFSDLPRDAIELLPSPEHPKPVKRSKVVKRWRRLYVQPENILESL